jgi:hypothetical protein
MFFGKRMGGMTYGGGGVALEAARGVSQSGNRIAGTAWHTHSPHRLGLGGHRWIIRMCGSEKYAQRTEGKRGKESEMDRKRGFGAERAKTVMRLLAGASDIGRKVIEHKLTNQAPRKRQVGQRNWR